MPHAWLPAVPVGGEADTGVTPYEEQRERRRRLMARAHLLAKELTLTDYERGELAMMLPGQAGASGPVSWGHLSDQDLARLVKWLHGTTLVVALLRQRA